MATTPMDERPRLSLKPLWAPQFNLGVFPGSSLKPTRGHIYAPSPRSPKALPTPVLPSASHEGSMRQHERALVERLDQRIHQSREGSEISPAGSAPVSRPLSPIGEGHTAASQRAPSISMSIPSAGRHVPPPPTPASPATTFPRRQTLVAETRSMLLAGLGEDAERRQSAPIHRSPIEAKKMQQAMMLEQLRAWGNVYHGDTKSADVFVQAVSLRNPSDQSSNCSEASNSAASSPQLQGKHVTVRARVRPRDIERKPFLIQREFDVDELRSTIPDPLPSGYVPPSPIAVARTPTLQVRQRSPLSSHPPRRRSSSARHGLLPSGHGLRPGSSVDARALMRGTNAMPMREYITRHLHISAS